MQFSPNLSVPAYICEKGIPYHDPNNRHFPHVLRQSATTHDTKTHPIPAKSQPNPYLHDRK